MLQNLKLLSFQDFDAFLGAVSFTCRAFQTTNHRILSWRTMTLITSETKQFHQHCIHPNSPCTCGRLPTPTSLVLPVPPWLTHRLTQGHHRDHTTARAALETSAEMGLPAWRRDPRLKNGSRRMTCCQHLPLQAQTRGFISKMNTTNIFPVKQANSRA